MKGAFEVQPARVAERPRSRYAKLVVLVSAVLSLSIFLPGYLTRDTPLLRVARPTAADPASEWKDDVWPLRPSAPWDISTDFPYPRKLAYDVTEGTWMRLDVHPQSGDIAFDMLGDVYCLPADAYRGGVTARARARPVLLGVPHDSDPHFSPDGSKLVFRSDAGLGVENIWVTEWKGCDAMDVRPESATGDMQVALALQDEEEEALASGIQETAAVKDRRLLREGRLHAHQVTNETFRWVSDARFHPSGKKVVATKWYTSERSLGAGEAWEYAIPDSFDAKIGVGSGTRIVPRSLPFGWGPEDYGDQQIGPEQFIWSGEDSLIYSQNVVDDGAFTYSKDVHSGIYAIFSTNLTTKQTSTLVSSFPGGASRPELSRDGRTLAFVRRVRDKEVLVLKDLITGSIHHVFDGLSYDLTTVSAPMGTYPSFAFTPNDDAVIIWAAGQIYHVPLSTNAVGERTKSKTTPSPIPFVAHVEKRLADTRSSDTDILALETTDTQRVHAFTELRANADGSKVTFQAAGASYVYDVKQKTVKDVPVLHNDVPYFTPSFVPNAEHLVIHARWSDTKFTTFELADLTSGRTYEVTGLPLGRYYSPVLCECSGSQRRIAFIKSSEDYLSGNIVATAGAGLYVGDITLPGADAHTLAVHNVQRVSTAVLQDAPASTKLRFLGGAARLLVQQSTHAYVVDLGGGADAHGEYAHETLAGGAMSAELVVNPRTRGVAFVDFMHVYYAPRVAADEAVWSKPGKATKGLARLSLDGGHDVVFSGDGKKLFWFLGPYLHSVDVASLGKCSSEIAGDKLNFGISCTKKLLKFSEVVVKYPTDVSRLQTDARNALRTDDEQALANADFLVFTNATLLTMASGSLQQDVLYDAVLVARGGKIAAIVGVQDYVIPYGATVIDAEGGFIVPGYIDVHAHWNGFADPFPAKSWELETFLAYGVTTLHNPSADNVRGFWERFRVERGQEIGPRIFQVGGVIYGAGAAELHQDIATMDEARAALIRIKVEGGPASYSYKNYNLPSRASRQRLLLAARNLSMLCVPEGGMNFDWDQTYIVDGMTTVEHALPVPELFDDVLALFALSGTGSTPTHIVNYGGAWGEQYVWATEDIPNDPKLRRFTRHDILESLSESTTRPRNSYALFNTSASTAKMVHMGLKAHIGAHGEPPLGLNYHAEMFFTQQGGLTNYEVVRAATADAAQTLGIFGALGSLTPGKLADFLVYPPGFNVLEDDIRKTRDIRYVVRGGRVWEAETMTEVWPVKGRKQVMPPINPE
ncbi:thioredoxin-like protein790 [Phanerochaete sordida]|uniref:Thioredoxin-like protein790 n=1 Tax=Phanerochaete sordida TaxID=48140 RepID=A0A9P3G5K7_9APHY|nr:thioredoxin-like protein790 [Phanerochaete sordida]